MVVAGYAGSGLTMPAYCSREGISEASFYRWRRVLGGRGQHTAVPAVTPVIMPNDFVDLGTLAQPSARLELRLDLGGGLVLQIARG
jgi:putative transposase